MCLYLGKNKIAGTGTAPKTVEIITTISTNTSSSNGSTTIAFPEGFNKDNCVVISKMWKCDTSYPNGSNYISGVASSLVKEFIVTLGAVDGTDNNNIYIQITDDSLVGLTFTVKVILMKIN